MSPAVHLSLAWQLSPVCLDHPSSEDDGPPSQDVLTLAVDQIWQENCVQTEEEKEKIVAQKEERGERDALRNVVVVFFWLKRTSFSCGSALKKPGDWRWVSHEIITHFFRLAVWLESFANGVIPDKKEGHLPSRLNNLLQNRMFIGRKTWLVTDGRDGSHGEGLSGIRQDHRLV